MRGPSKDHRDYYENPGRHRPRPHADHPRGRRAASLGLAIAWAAFRAARTANLHHYGTALGFGLAAVAAGAVAVTGVRR